MGDGIVQVAGDAQPLVGQRLLLCVGGRARARCRPFAAGGDRLSGEHGSRRPADEDQQLGDVGVATPTAGDDRGGDVAGRADPADPPRCRVAEGEQRQRSGQQRRTAGIVAGDVHGVVTATMPTTSGQRRQNASASAPTTPQT